MASSGEAQLRIFEVASSKPVASSIPHIFTSVNDELVLSLQAHGNVRYISEVGKIARYLWVEPRFTKDKNVIFKFICDRTRTLVLL